MAADVSSEMADIKAMATGGTMNAEARAQALRAVQLRSQLRQQRIKERVEQATTAEAAYLNPSEQWESYMARCGKWSPGGRGRKPSPERLRLAHQTATRIFSESAAAAEEAVIAAVGPHEAAAAMAAHAGGGPPELRAPIVDSHGMWVGEKIEAALSGAAGASSTALWRKKEEQKLEQRRLDFLAKAAERSELAASGMDPSNPGEGSGIAGLSSKSLYKNMRERSGLLDEMAVRAPTPPGGRLGAEDSLFDTRPVPVKGAVGGQAPRRAVAGMTSGEIFEANTSKARGHGAHATPEAGVAKVAGVASADLAAATTEMKLEVAKPSVTPLPHQRLDCEVKAAMTEGAGAPSIHQASLAVVSNAPADSFDGAAGMCSAEVHKTRSDLGQKRHVSSLDEVGSVTAAAAAPMRPPPVPRLAIKPGTFSMGGSPEKGPLAAGGLAPITQPPTQAADAQERYAGQRSHLIQKPTNAWEARHVWSEQVPAPKGGGSGRMSPRGGFGAHMSHSAAALQAAGGAGMTSGQLASKTAELRLERDTSPAGPRIKAGAAAIAAASAAGGGSVDGAGQELFNGAAGLTSGKICEIGPGQVNKFDGGSPAKAAAERKKWASQLQAPLVGRAPGVATGAAGLTSHEVASKVLSEQTAEPKNLSMMAAQAAQRSEFAPGGGIAQRTLSPSMYRNGQGQGHAAVAGGSLALSGAPSFSGAAGVGSDQKGKEVIKREFMESVSMPAAGDTPRRGQASPTLRRSGFNANSSAGVAHAIFGGESAAVVARAAERMAALGVDYSGSHGLSSQQVALNRLVSRQAVGANGGRRSASEPRRRPGAEGDAGSLIYGNKHAQAMRDSDAIGLPRTLVAESALAHKIAGRTSSDLAMPREERRLSRKGNAPDNLMGFGGLGGFMGDGGGAVHTEGNSGRRISVGQPAVAQVDFSAARAYSPRACSPRAPPPPALQCHSPARPAAGMRVASPAARFTGGRENFGSPAAGKASTWVTSSSAVGSGWGASSQVAQAQAQFKFTGSPGARGLRA